MIINYLLIKAAVLLTFPQCKIIKYLPTDKSLTDIVAAFIKPRCLLFSLPKMSLIINVYSIFLPYVTLIKPVVGLGKILNGISTKEVSVLFSAITRHQLPVSNSMGVLLILATRKKVKFSNLQLSTSTMIVYLNVLLFNTISA